MEEVFREYSKVLTSNPDIYYDDYNLLYNKLEDSHAYYQGEVIPFLYQPFFFSEEEANLFTDVVTTLNQILIKVINKYLEEEDFRQYFDFSSRLEELILVEPGYQSNLPLGRFDVFYYGGSKIKFCELNADGSSGMVKTNILEKNFKESRAVEELQKKYELDYLEAVDSWVDTLLVNYEEFPGAVEKPNIAIMDFKGYGMRGEFKQFKEVIERRGLEVKIVDPREVKYDGDYLYKDDFRIDLVYRRAVTTDLMDYYNELDDLLEAYREQAVCIVGSFRSQVIHNKVIFSILHDEEKVSFLTAEELDFVKETIPYTINFTDIEENQLAEVINNKDDWVLKPRDDYGAHGVVIGCDVSQNEWETRVEKLDPANYLLQEFLPLPEKELATFNQAGEVDFESYKYSLGLFSYNGELHGIYTRADQKNVIASAAGCVTLPNFVVK
jgi:glutathionylspermidine synthase